MVQPLKNKQLGTTGLPIMRDYRGDRYLQPPIHATSGQDCSARHGITRDILATHPRLYGQLLPAAAIPPAEACAMRQILAAKGQSQTGDGRNFASENCMRAHPHHCRPSLPKRLRVCASSPCTPVVQRCQLERRALTCEISSVQTPPLTARP